MDVIGRKEGRGRRRSPFTTDIISHEVGCCIVIVVLLFYTALIPLWLDV